MNTAFQTKIKTIRALFVFTGFLLPFSLYAQNFAYINTFLGWFIVIIDRAIPLLVGIALVMFIWGLVVFIAKADSEQEREVGKQKMIWGIVALFVISSVWGLVALLQEITGVDGAAVGLAPPGIPAP